MRITMIGHSTVLLDVAGVRLITDPYFGSLGHVAYARVDTPSLSRGDVPDVDAVLLSHLHWDHVDRRYLRSLPESTPVLTRAAVRWLARVKGARQAVGLRAWESTTVGEVKVTAVPALHMARTIGFVIEGEGRAVYFAGDTYRRPFMRRIGATFRLDVALMPVTTFRIPMTMGEKAAAKAVGDLGAAVIIPIHLGVQPRSPLMRTRHSPEGFTRRLRQEGGGAEVVVLGPGDSWEMPEAKGATES